MASLGVEADAQAGGLGASAVAGLELVLGKLADHVDQLGRAVAKIQSAWADVHPVPILGAITLATGAGTWDQPDYLGPKDGYWWELHRLTVWGFTAGTVTVYKNSSNGTRLAQFAQAGEWTWSGNMQWLAPRDRLIFVAAGITGSVQIDGMAIEVSAQTLPSYLI